MTHREMNLAVFRREPLPHVFFQPRFEPWFAWHEQFESLPAELEGATLRDAYDLAGASMRTVHYYTGQPAPLDWGYEPDVTVTRQEERPDLVRKRYDTPHGPLFETLKLTVDRTWRTIGFPAGTVDDLPALRWLLERRRITFSPERYRVGFDFIGDRGYGHFWVPKCPYLTLAQQYFKYEDFIYALADRPAEIEDLFRIIDERYDPLYEQLTACDLVKILNFGENIAMAHWSPRYFETYAIPWYEKRAGQLQRAGIFTHIHIDGNFKPLLPYLADLPFDGLEALTPEPQGDVTLDEMHDAMGDKILLDGIPAVLFLDHHRREALEACVERVCDLFHPRLVLGASDELPEAGGDDAWQRLKWVAQYARNRTGE